MIGRAIYQKSLFLKEIENNIFKNYDIFNKRTDSKRNLKIPRNEVKPGQK